jgi:5-methylcytosine-specific restriction endonuclease McrA
MPSRPKTHEQRLREQRKTAYSPQYLPEHDHRQNASARGYGWQWQKFRKWYAALHPAICVACGASLESARMHLDHIIPMSQGGQQFDESNLQWLCDRCHRIKSNREDRRGVGAPPAMRRFVIAGPPGSGKSTYVSNQRQPGDVLWCYDTIMQAMTGLSRHDRPEELVGMMQAMRGGLVDWWARQPIDRGLWIIVTDVEPGTQIASSIGGRLIVMQTEKEECIRRLRADNRSSERLERMVMEWEPPQPQTQGGTQKS